MVMTLLLLLLAAAAQSLPGRGMRCGCNYRLQALAPSQVLPVCMFAGSRSVPLAGEVFTSAASN